MVKIHDTNECSICGDYLVYKIGYKPVVRYVFETIILTHCKDCKALLKKIDKIKADLLNSEFELFCRTESNIFE